ncbi:MAG: hypothetical protein IJQ43_02170 [Oscillospiraceae bacterium]|nr:hypothetical protein [Oscillospiraceae bacterium]
MFDRVTGLKNILWAIGIVLCLLALLVGFLVSAVTPYAGETDPRTPDLNAVRDQNSSADVSALTFVEPDGQLHLLRESKDAGAEYISSSVFLTDSAMIVLREQSLTGGDVWGSESGNLPIGSVATWNILFSDGSKISPIDACMIDKPARLFIVIGSDGLDKISRDEFISGYKTLITSILRVSPQTQIVCCSVSPITADYNEDSYLDNDMIANANDWLREICLDTGVYFADTASALLADGNLDPRCAAENGRALNSTGAQAVLDYLRTHAIPSL